MSVKVLHKRDHDPFRGTECTAFLQVNSETLKEVFSKVGKVGSAVVMREQSGASRGFGFVNFTKPEEAEKAIHQFNRVPHSAGNWLVSLLPWSSADQHVTTHELLGSFHQRPLSFLVSLGYCVCIIQLAWVICFCRCGRLRKGSQSRRWGR